MPPKAPPALFRLIDPSMPFSTDTLPRGTLGSLLPPVRGIEDNLTRPPQEAPVDEHSDSSSEQLYFFSSDEDYYSEDAVQHAPWVARECLPTNMQPQDGAFKETLREVSPAENSRPLRPENDRTSRNESMSHMRDHDTGSLQQGLSMNQSSFSDQAGRRGCPPSLHCTKLS